MNQNTRRKKIWIVASGIVLSLILLIFVGIGFANPILNKYVNKNAERLLNNNPQSLYTCSIEAIRIDLWAGGLEVTNLKIEPKDSASTLYDQGLVKQLLFLSSNQVTLSGLDLWKWYAKKAVFIAQFSIQSPLVTLKINPEVADTDTNKLNLGEVFSTLQTDIAIENIAFNDISLNVQVNKPQHTNRFSIDSLNFTIKNIAVGPSVLQNGSPVQVEDMYISSEKIQYTTQTDNIIEIEKFYYSLYNKTLSGKKINVENKHTNNRFSTDSLTIDGLSINEFLKDNCLRTAQLNVYHPVFFTHQNHKGKLTFSDFFQLNMELDSVYLHHAEVVINKAKNEKIKLQGINLLIAALNNTQTVNSLQRIRATSVHFSGNPQLIFNQNQQIHKLHITDFYFSANKLFTDSVLFHSHLLGGSESYTLDFKQLEYRASNADVLRISGINIDKKGQEVSLNRIFFSKANNQKSENLWHTTIEKLSIKGYDIKSMIRKNKIDLPQIDVSGLHNRIELWKDSSSQLKANFEAYTSIPLHIHKINFKNTSFDATLYSSAEQYKAFKIHKLDFSISELSNYQLNKQLEEKELAIKKLQFHGNPQISWIDSLGKESNNLTLQNFKLDFNTIFTTQSVWNSSEPIHIETYFAQSHKMYLTLGKHYDLYLASFSFNEKNKTLIFNDLLVQSKYSKNEHAKRLGSQIEWVYFTAESVHVLGIDVETMLLNKKTVLERVFIPKAVLRTYRDKNEERPLFKEKPLPQKALASLPFLLHIKECKLEDALIVYEELTEGKQTPGEINFQKTNITISNISNLPEQLSQNKEMNINFHTDFMGKMPLTATYKFNLTALDNAFTLEGNIGKADLSDVFDETMHNLLGLGIRSGTVNWAKFYLKANNDRCSGWLDMHYENLQVGINKEHDKKTAGYGANWLLEGVANAIITPHNINVRKFRRGIIDAKRLKDRSVFNYSWQGLRSGILSSIGLKKSLRIELE